MFGVADCSSFGLVGASLRETVENIHTDEGLSINALGVVVAMYGICV